MSGKIADLYADVSFKFNQVKLREVSKYIGDINISSIIAATSLVGLGLGIKDLIDETSTLAISLATLHSATGIDPIFQQKFENASIALLSSKESADSFISSLSKIKAAINLPGGTVPIGLRLMGFTKQDFQGTLEDNAKMIWTRLSASKPPAGASQALKEQWQGLLTNLTSTFGISSEQMMAMSNSAFGEKFDAANFVPFDELNESIKATENWREATTKLNVEWERFSTIFLPIVNGASGLLEKLADLTGGERAGLALITGQKTKEQTLAEDPLKKYFNIDSSKLEDRLEKLFHASASSKPLTINMGAITVVAQDVAAFEKWFKNYWDKYITKTANQYILGQT